MRVLFLGEYQKVGSDWGFVQGPAVAWVVHEAKAYKEWGVTGAVRFDPDRQGRGFACRLVANWPTVSLP